MADKTAKIGKEKIRTEIKTIRTIELTSEDVEAIIRKHFGLGANADVDFSVGQGFNGATIREVKEESK